MTPRPPPPRAGSDAAVVVSRTIAVSESALPAPTPPAAPPPVAATPAAGASVEATGELLSGAAMIDLSDAVVDEDAGGTAGEGVEAGATDGAIEAEKQGADDAVKATVTVAVEVDRADEPSPAPEPSIPVELGEPSAASLAIPVELGEVSSSPSAGTAPGAGDFAVDLTDLPSSPGTGLAPAMMAAPSGAPVEVTFPEVGGRLGSRRWTWLLTGLGLGLLAIVGVLLARGGATGASSPAVGSEASPVAAAPVPTVSAEPPSEETLSDPMSTKDEPSAGDESSAGDEPSAGDESPRRRPVETPTRADPPQTAASAPAASETAEGEEAAAPAATGTVNIYSSPPAAVFVDGARIGTTPRQVTLPVGKHTIVVEDPEFGRQSVQVDVQAKKQHSVNLTLD